ncbi:MAG: UDP-N-acetylmuramoyl-L-alanine--D-glutamate ligase, partial [Planctomycetota bacterium]
LVMGLGSFGGGVGVVRYLAQQGARVLATDLRRAEELAPALTALADLDVEYVLGEHRERDFDAAELVIANPAVAPSNALLERARARGARISSEMELFLEACPARVIAITGTQGKSSTSAFTAQLLEHSGIPVHLGGNIGRSLLDATAAMRADDWCVVEISSYQLEALAAPAALTARVAAVCIVNVLADHLERHGTLDAYRAAKLRILQLVADDGVALLPGCDERLATAPLARGRRELYWPPDAARQPSAAQRAAGWHVDAGSFRCGALEVGFVADFAVPGRFQRGNALAALALARAAGAAPERLRAAIPRLAGLEYRMQELGVRAGHRVIDNGVSTTPDSTLAALADMREPVVLLCGGKAKNLPLDELVECARSKVALALCFGAAAEPLARAFAARGVDAQAVADVPTAVARAFERAREGQAILFSPACASFDAYLNFEQRAQHFRACLPPRDGGAAG